MTAPNEIQTLLAAGRSLVGTAILASDGRPDHTQISEYLKVNEDSLNSARRALSGDCRVSFSFDPALFEEQCNGIDPLKNLARSFELELSVAERSGDTSEVIARAGDLFDLAKAVRRGGLVINVLIGIAFEDMAIRRLRPLRRQLSATANVVLANALLQADSDREPFDRVALRDAQWEATAMKDGQLPLSTPPLTTEDQNEPVDEVQQALRGMAQAFLELPLEQRQAFHRQNDYKYLAILRLLAIESALNACHKTRGTYPSSLTDLVPEYIARLPRDPFTGSDFTYRQSGGSFLLYSPGPTGKDLGGNFGHWFDVLAGRADLCLDEADYNMACILPAARRGTVTRLFSRLRSLLRRRRDV